MKVAYKNKLLEQVVTGVRAAVSLVAVASFALLFGFYEPPMPEPIVFRVQTAVFLVFLASKLVRLFNARSVREYLYVNWYDIPALLLLGVVMLGGAQWFGEVEPHRVQHLAIAVYLIFEVTSKFFLMLVSLAATGRNPAKILAASFVVLIVTGAGLLMLPKATPGRAGLPLVDALFTSTSATCVTGLIVRNTDAGFTLLGQIVILTQIQLGALGIMVFGAVFALLLGQALSLRESVAMQDLLSSETVSRIGSTILFIFIVTMVFESIGALALFPMWNDIPTWDPQRHSRWFYSIFHSISAFCNAGFDLTGDSLIRYRGNWQVYGVMCPLIILGGLGFGVLYNLIIVTGERARLFLSRRIGRSRLFAAESLTKVRLQSKIVLSVSGLLIVVGTLAILLFERFAGGTQPGMKPSVPAAIFQSITARTAGFNTVPIADLTPSSRIVLMLLMFIGGSPGSTAGGIKTVTFAVIVMTVVTTLRKRGDVEMFKRSIRPAVLTKAVTVAVLFVTVLVVGTMALTITERSCYPGRFTLQDLAFEVGSALGTVGLSTGVTPALTNVGKLIIIATMLIGRLGPLTLVAALTFNLRPARYSYPEEVVIVG